MIPPAEFAELIRRVRGGDEQAAADLVRHCEPLIRREVRLRLEDPALARLFDSLDVCQSVFASFFVRAAAGQYDLNHPGQLVRLLTTMARHKLASEARRQGRQKRDRRRASAHDSALDAVADTEASPSRVVAGRELLERFRAGLSEEERRLADLRAAGLGWEEIANRVGGTAQARRMQLTRATDRVARELGLDGGGDV